MMENEVMKKTVIVTAIGSFSAKNVISACHKVCGLWAAIYTRLSGW